MCIGSVTGLAVAAQTKIEVLVSALSNSLDVSSTTRVGLYWLNEIIISVKLILSWYKQQITMLILGLAFY